MKKDYSSRDPDSIFDIMLDIYCKIINNSNSTSAI